MHFASSRTNSSTCSIRFALRNAEAARSRCTNVLSTFTFSTFAWRRNRERQAAPPSGGAAEQRVALGAHATHVRQVSKVSTICGDAVTGRSTSRPGRASRAAAASPTPLRLPCLLLLQALKLRPRLLRQLIRCERGGSTSATATATATANGQVVMSGMRHASLHCRRKRACMASGLRCGTSTFVALVRRTRSARSVGPRWWLDSWKSQRTTAKLLPVGAQLAHRPQRGVPLQVRAQRARPALR